ncbi:MAG: hypothetical protein J6X40_06050 [Bacteroidales bacterium]|nr:hypothetical protein [Bacteroidales bacterium]
MKRSLFLWILFLFCSCVLSCSRQEQTVFNAVPQETALLLESEDVSGFLQCLEGKTYLDPFLQSDPDVAWMKDLVVRLDSALAKDQSLRAKVLASSMALASVPVDGEGHALLVAQLKDKSSDAELKRFFRANGWGADFRQNGRTKYYYLRDLDSLFVFMEGPFLGMSRNTDVIERVFAQLQGGAALDSDEGFHRLQQTLGHHVKAHCYYRDPRGWAALDVLPGNEGLVVNGYLLPADSLSSLKPLKYQLPVKNSIVNILPFDTRFMLHYGMSDYASYWQSFRDEAAVKALDKRYGVDVEAQLLNHLSEVSLDVLGSDRREVFVGRMSDPAAVIKFMDKLAVKVGVKESQQCQGYVLNDLGERDFVPVVFGPDFKSIKRFCYAIVDQYLVIAPGFGPLQELIACYRSGRTLDMNENFRAFQQQMLESCNITVFATGKGNQPRVAALTGGAVERFLQGHRDLLDGFQAVSIQLASSKDLVYTNLCLTRQERTNDESNIRWKVNLDAPLSGKPYLVPGAETDRNWVVAFDRQNRMYLIDSEGKLLWKRDFDEPPLGDVFPVEGARPGLLLNTAHSLQCVDASGDDLPGYPVRLPFEASNGLAVFDYDHNHDYRILLCGTDKLVYNYTLAGEEVEGWNHHRSEDRVAMPVQHVVAGDKDYLIVSDVSGGVRLLDRQGRIRIPLPSDMQKAAEADLYANATNRSKGLFLTSDKEGKLLYVTADGALNRTDFGTYSNRHYFLYEDFDGDKDPDFIYLDGQDLQVFDRFKKSLFAYHFDVDIHTKPVFFNITRSKRLLGIVSGKTREIYLIDRKGRMIVNSGLVGETPFAVGSLHNDQEINLITGVGNALFNYAIQ